MNDQLGIVYADLELLNLGAAVNIARHRLLCLNLLTIDGR